MSALCDIRPIDISEQRCQELWEALVSTIEFRSDLVLGGELLVDTHDCPADVRKILANLHSEIVTSSMKGRNGILITDDLWEKVRRVALFATSLLITDAKNYDVLSATDSGTTFTLQKDTDEEVDELRQLVRRYGVADHHFDVIPLD